MAFGAALVLPGLVLASILLWRYASAERHHYEEETLGTAQRIMAAVDRELVGIQSAAQALATSSSLLDGNFEAFQRQAEMTLRSWAPHKPNDYAIVVRDTAGQQVANTRVPWGSPLPKGANQPVDQQVIATKQPVVQDLFTGAAAGRPGKVSETLLDTYLSKGAVSESALTSREKAVVQLIAEGKTNKQIADILTIGSKTVETHRAMALRKLNLDTTAALIRYAIRNGLVEA